MIKIRPVTDWWDANDLLYAVALTMTEKERNKFHLAMDRARDKANVTPTDLVVAIYYYLGVNIDVEA